jgi:adenine deaminase
MHEGKRVKNPSAEQLIDVAVGRAPADCVIRDGSLINVNTAEIYQADVALKGNRIAFVGDVKHTVGKGTTFVDSKGMYLLPGLIDTHVHSSESGLTITEYARAVIPHGTTSIVNDSYGPGVFAGPKALRFELTAAKQTPLKVFFSTPVGTGYYQGDPFTNSETLREKQQMEMLDWPEAHGINEVMPDKVAEKDKALLRIVKRATQRGKVIYGHGGVMRGAFLQAWVAGVQRVVDHEAITVDEAVEKARIGIRIAVRESCISNIDLVKAISDAKVDPRYFMFCSDVGSPVKFEDEGNIDLGLRLAVKHGIPPVTAVQMATINAAEYMRMDHDIGSISPGKIADIVLVDDLNDFSVRMVLANGKLVAKDGKMVAPIPEIRYPRYFRNTVRLKKSSRPRDFEIHAPENRDMVTVRAIGVVPDNPITEERNVTLTVTNGLVLPDRSKDIAKITVMERYRGTGEIGRGFVQGYRMKAGAFASTYICQYHDLYVIGMTDEDMALAVNELVDSGGGFVVVKNGNVLARLQYPLSGLMAEEPFERTADKLRGLQAALDSLGSFGTLPFAYTLYPVIPLSHYGTIKVGREGLTVKWKKVPLFV